MQRLFRNGGSAVCRGMIRRRLVVAPSSTSTASSVIILDRSNNNRFTTAQVNSSSNNISIRSFSDDTSSTPATTTTATNSSSRYAIVDHSDAYEASMSGPHGRQLALARLEGQGKDDPPFDPFLEEEEEQDDDEDEAYLEEDEGEEVETTDEKYGDDVIEAEYSNKDEKDGDGDLDEKEEVEDDYSEEDEEEEEEDHTEDDALSVYNRDGSVRRSKSVLATLRAGYPSGGLFAVIEMGGSQHKVTADDLVVVNRLKPVEKYAIGTIHTLTDILLVGSTHKTLVGMPTVPGAEVDVMVEEITQEKKVIIFKKRRRKNSQRKNGFRRDVTLLRVLDVRMPEEHKDHKHIGREIVDDLEAEFEAESSLSSSNSDDQQQLA